MDINKERINLITKQLNDGRMSIYLDYSKGKKRIRESLHLYLLPETSNRNVSKNKKTLREAQAVKQEREKELMFFENGIIIEKPESKKLLVEIIDSYKQELADMGSHSTVKNVNVVRKAVIQFKGENIKIGDIDEAYCRGFIEFLRTGYKTRCGKALSMNSAEAFIYLFSACLNKAVKEGIINKSPLCYIKISDNIKKQSVPKTFLGKDEIKLLMETQCPVISRPQVKQAFLFSCFCGLSFKDIQTLHWKDIKTEDGQCTVAQHLRSNRVPLSRMAMRWLPEVANKRGLVYKGLPGFVRIEQILKQWAEKAGITQNMTFNVARNTFVYLMLTTGSDLATVSNILGIKRISAIRKYATMAGYVSKTHDQVFDYLSNL